MKEEHGTVFATRLKELRERKNLTQTELASILGYKNYTTVSKWESGDSLPRGKELKFLSEYFKVSSDYLLGLNDVIVSSIETIYNQLEEPRQKVVYNFAEAQLSEQHASKTVPIVGLTAANPQGIVNGDTVYDESISADVPDKADAALTVKGDSMEPDFKNGSIVFYRKQPTIENGELAIVEIEGGVTFKKVVINDDDVHLVSLNKAHEDKVIKKEDLRIVGKVVQ